MRKSILEANFIMFDLDNTLFEETDYLFQGYEKIALYLSKKHQLSTFDIYKYLSLNFKFDDRSNLFDNMLEEFNIPQFELPNILDILRTYTPYQKIQLYPELKQVLIEIKSKFVPFVIVTNGNVTQQQNKIKHIDWGNLKPLVYYANNCSPKPSPQIYFDCILPRYRESIKKGKIFYIGDSKIDQIFAENIGFDFIDVTLLKKH
jgi:FMN phosphatase YigB (HAD superfamily)